MSKAKPALGVLVWGLDAETGDEKIQLATAKAIGVLTKGRAKIFPVGIITPPGPYPARGRLLEIFEEENSRVSTVIEARLKKMRLVGLQPLTIKKAEYSIRSQVAKIVRHAEEIKADAIVVSTHARKGLGRFFLGSFAETLLLTSTVPVIIVNPKAKASPCKHILFPTDFGPKAKATLDKVCDLAKTLGAKVTLYHKVDVINPYTVGTFHAVPLYQSYLKQSKEEFKELASKLVVIAEQAKVPVKVVINDDADFPAEGILKKAKSSKANLIALTAQSGKMSALLIGSVTREIARRSMCPVWVIRNP